MNLRRWMRRLAGRVAGVRARLGWYPVRRNVNGADLALTRRRALLLYRITPFRLPEGHPEFLRHHNMRRSRRIAALLHEFGYVVDVANGRQARFKPPAGRYDVVLSDRADIRATFPPETTTIFLGTVPAHPVHNARMRRRYEALTARRGATLQRHRVYDEAMPFARTASAVIAIGNDATAGTWHRVAAGRVYQFDNYAFADTRAVEKDFAHARSHFLFFASRTQVQKGLDLLLEIFPRFPHLHLHVCSLFAQERDFVACYRRELLETANVHPVGWITANSDAFYDLVRTTAYVIHPSCAEGQASSVVQCMAAGLIPIVTRETGLDLDDVGVTLADDSLATIERAILDVSARPAGWHARESTRTRARAEARHTEPAFTARWKTILGEVLGGQSPRHRYGVR